MVPSFFPLADLEKGTVNNGDVLKLSDFCEKKIKNESSCSSFYKGLLHSSDGVYQCPFGFTTRVFSHLGKKWAFTGVIAFPRFDSESERRRAKEHPQLRTTREAIESNLTALRNIETAKADAIQEAATVFPQALHELRKLNGAVIQHSEKAIQIYSENRNLLSIKSAAELMRNNFDILEALAEIEGLKSLKNDSTINAFDLLFKMKRIYQERAEQKQIAIILNGPRAIFYGSQKSFPIVPAVLLENSIKYGIPNSKIKIEITVQGDKIILSIENQADKTIDPERCFERGVRFSNDTEGGGFGLFLAREVVRCHSGTIRCQLTPTTESQPTPITVKMIVGLPLHKVIS